MIEPQPGDVLVKSRYESYHPRDVYIVVGVHSRYQDGELRALTVRRRGDDAPNNLYNLFARAFKRNNKFRYLPRECVWKSK